MDPVAARAAPTEDEHGVLRADAVPNDLRFLPEADARHVDDDVPEVAFVEHDAARDRRDSDPVPVVADARDDAAKEILRMSRAAGQLLHRVIERAEVQRIREGDRLGAHREDVAQDPADARVRAAVGLDRGRMIVALDTQGVRVVFVEFDHAGVPSVDHVRRLNREDELLENHLGGLVAAMFRPRLSEALELHLGRVASEILEVRLDPPHFVHAECEPHPFADRREFVCRGVAQRDVMEREREGPPPDSIAQPFASFRRVARDTLCFSFLLRRNVPGHRRARRTFK